MRRRSAIPPLLCVLAVALTAPSPGAGPGTACAQEPRRAAVRIAVADITRIFNSYNKRLEYQEKLEATGKSLREREQLMKTRLRDLEQEISRYAMGHPRRLELLEDLKKRRQEYARFSVEARRELDDSVRESTAVLYEDITRAIEEYARGHRVDLVIKQQSFKPQQVSAEKQADSIGRRTVLYCAPDLEITERIIEILNRKPKAEPTPVPQ